MGTLVPDKPALSDSDWSAIAFWMKNEKERRAEDKRRKYLETMWKEIDRQICMDPIPKKVESGRNEDWLPDVELPLQFNALEVNAADARRLKFPRGSEWYSAYANLSDKYLDRFSLRREKVPMVGNTPTQMKLDQETANTLIKATIDFFHRIYDFRLAVDMFDIECIKYGTAVVRVREVRIPKFHHDYRGTFTKSLTGPAIIPVSIKDMYLDDTPIFVMHEGLSVSPLHIRRAWRNVKDIKNSIKVGGPDRGWRIAALEKIIPLKDGEKKDYIEVLEAEGDIIVQNGDKSIFLPNVDISVAISGGGPEVIRYQEIKRPSYLIGHYIRDDIASPYGTSPLIKGQPIQEAATASLNTMLAAAALAARPPCFYDRNDAEFATKKGPDLFPGSLSGTDAPNAVEFMKSTDVSALTATYLALVKQYEDLTAVNDPRRGGQMKSHTTATAIDIEQSRGLARTEDFVQGIEQGPMTSMLYMEYDIIKESLKTPVPIRVDANGIEGWVSVSADDLADEVQFQVHGSAGVINERQQLESFTTATNMAGQILGIAAQLGQQIPVDFQKIILEVYKRAGINNASTFIGTAPGANSGGGDVSAETAPGADVMASFTGVPQNDLKDVAAAFGV